MLCKITVRDKVANRSCSVQVLSAYFEQFGEIASVQSMVKDGFRKTSIIYKQVESVSDVMEISNIHGGLTIQGNELTVQQTLPYKVCMVKLNCTNNVSLCGQIYQNLTKCFKIELKNSFIRCTLRHILFLDLIKSHKTRGYETSQVDRAKSNTRPRKCN